MTITAPTNPALILDDGAITYAPTGGGTFTRKGTIDGLAYVYDSGPDLVPKTFVAALQASVLDLTTGNEQYVVTIEGGNGIATDGDGNVSLTGEVRGLDEWSMSVADQQDIRGISTLDPLDNTLWRYIRVSIQVSGTTPEIALSAWLRPLSDMEPYEFAELVQLQVFTQQNLQNAIACWLPWANGVAGGGPNSDGKYPIYDGFGHSTLVACPKQWAADFQVDVPVSFGAIGGGFSHPASEIFETLAACQAVYPFATSLAQEMDYLAMQKAWNTGRKIGSPPVPYKMCNADPESQSFLTAISGVAWVEATAARLDFSALAPKTSDEHFIEDYNFALTSGTPWVNATVYDPGIHDDATFGGGEATCLDTRTDGSSPFFQWGEQVTLSPGRYTAICTYTASHGGSYAHGNPTIPYASIAFFSSSPGVGGGFTARSADSRPNVAAVDATDTVTMKFDFEITEAGTSFYTFSGFGWADWHITYMDIVPVVLNCAILMTRDGSPEHYPIMQPLTGLWIEGPGYDTGITGVLWKSFSYMDGNVQSMRSCNVTGFQFGIETSDGAYLLELENINIFGNFTGYHHRPGSFNAGENVRFRGGGIYNNANGIDNDGGADINLLNTAIDYNTQAIINNTGFVTVSQTHIEQWADSRSELPIFHCKAGGRISCSQVRWLGAGTPGTMPVPPIQLDTALSAMTWDNCDIYNLSSATGFASSGPGMLRITNFQKMGNPWIGPLGLSPNPNMDVLAGAGFFEPLPYVWPGMPVDEICLEGALWPHSTHTFTDRWTSEYTTVSISTAYAYTGTRSLKVSRAVSTDYSRNDSLNLLIPTKGGNIMGEFRVLFPNDTVPYDLMKIYFREWWVKVIGQDAYGRPIYGPKLLFAGETDLDVPETGSMTWVQRGIGTLYADDTTDAAAEKAIYPPAWATHLLLMLDHQSVPALDYYIDGLWANEIG